MNDNQCFVKISGKLNRRYPSGLRTNNTSLNTRIFYSFKESLEMKQSESTFHIAANELPILKCDLPNGNRFLMTTKSMYSVYNGKTYLLNYIDYQKTKSKSYKNTGEIVDGKTHHFVYLSHDQEEFYYEIDSFYPTDAAHNVILHEMTVRNPEWSRYRK